MHQYLQNTNSNFQTAISLCTLLTQLATLTNSALVGEHWERNSLCFAGVDLPKVKFKDDPSPKISPRSIFNRLMEGIFRRCEFKCNCALPNGRYIHQMWRLSHTKDFSGAAAWCRGYFQPRGRGSGIGRYQLQGLHGTSMHSQMGCLELFPGVCMQKNGSWNRKRSITGHCRCLMAS